MDATKVLAKAIERRVAFVPGMAFYAADPDPRTMRMSFVTVPEPKAPRGRADPGRGHRRGLILRAGGRTPPVAFSGGAAPDPGSAPVCSPLSTTTTPLTTTNGIPSGNERGCSWVAVNHAVTR